MLLITMSTDIKRIVPKGIKWIIYGFIFSEDSTQPTLQISVKSGSRLTFSYVAIPYVQVAHLVIIQQRLNKNIS